MAEKIINVDDTEQIINLFGTYDENINAIQRQYNVVVLRDVYKRQAYDR